MIIKVKTKYNKQPIEVNSVKGIHCISGKSEKFEIRHGSIKSMSIIESPEKELPYIGPGLIDLQVNGINGIDFNDIALTQNDLLEATRYLLSTGVTIFFPTVITNSDDSILQILKTIHQACEADPLVNLCIGGIHLEGPFISKAEGARGAHHQKYVKAPDWNLITTFQEASGGRVKLITLAPEWEGSSEFIQRCRQHGILVSIGHSNATSEQIRMAIKAGATLSTHLGNGAPLMLPRHPNLLWEQLAQDDLYASIIADGFHLPDSFLKVVIRTKGDRALLVSDATCFSGMAPGVYSTHIGEEVVLNKEGKLALKSSPGLLAGATKSLLEDIQYLMNQDLVSLSTAWKMGSINPARFLREEQYGLFPGQQADLVMFQLTKRISITKVIKNGQVVFEK